MNTSYVPVKTGCVDFEPYGFTDLYANSSNNWTTCCNELSDCYQLSCGVHKDACDKKFKSCVVEVVEQNPATTTTMSTTTASGDQ